MQNTDGKLHSNKNGAFLMNKRTMLIRKASSTEDGKNLWGAIVSFLYASDKPIKVTIEQATDKRRDAQNRLMWRWHNEFVVHRYNYAGEVFSPLAWHEPFKEQFIGTDDPVKIKGKWVVRAKSTTGLNVKEFALMLTKYEVEAAEEGCLFSQPDDLYFNALMKQGDK